MLKSYKILIKGYLWFPRNSSKLISLKVLNHNWQVLEALIFSRHPAQESGFLMDQHLTCFRPHPDQTSTVTQCEET